MPDWVDPAIVTETLRAVGLKKSYKKRCVVNNVSLHVRPGEVVGLLGPNGAGKTTTFYMILGLVDPDEGDIFLKGKCITKLPIYMRARQGVTYLPQEPSIFRKMTVEDNLLTILETLNLSKQERYQRLEALLDDLGIRHVRKTMGYALSGGERRRTEIARALVIEPQFMLLDEPFAGIDPLAVLDLQTIIRDLKARGIGVLITDHNVRETLAITDRAYIINEGKIFRSGTPQELTDDPMVRRVYLGEGFRL
ncbi:MAG: LPS export ABC transporter ATP-binding protein [Acidobacteriota bacterium]|nr:LPS export ABC transporter ATP-binding protein [Blastocatellia bacterium]MDW8238507.1 LPS export ABC transporter ATP-binding protein [Acidobacteriota bacterium]